MLGVALPFLGAVVAMYLAVRAAADTTGHRPALALALGAALPALAGGGAAVAAGEASAGLSFVMAVAVACVTLVLGLGLTTPPDADAPAAPRDRTNGRIHAGAGLLPGALVALVAGFAGAITPVTAVVTLAAGAALATLVWPSREAAVPTSPRWARGLQMLLAAGLAVAAWAWAQSGTAALSARLGWDLGVAAPTLLLGPLVALPLVGVATRDAARGRGGEVIAGLSLGASACVTLVLPIVALAAITPTVATAGLDLAAWRVEFPLRAWRLDAVLLAIVGLLVLPASAGRWRLGRAEGVGLILLYAAHLAATAASSR